MQLPIVNLNGTSRASLIAQYDHALQIVGDAIGALHQIEVHGRDYVYGGKFAEAQEEHVARIATLRTVQRDLETIRLHLEL